MRTTAITTDLPVPGRVVYDLAEDGLTWRATYQGPDGEVTSTLSWSDPEVARANYGAARAAFEQRLPSLVRRLDGVAGRRPSTDNSRLRVLHRSQFGVLDLYTNSGGPIWRLPRVGLRVRGRFEIRAGWLYGCFSLRFRPAAR